MGRWDEKTNKDKKINKFEEKIVNINTKINSYIPKPILKVMMRYAKWVNKHGIQLPLYVLSIIMVAYMIFSLFFVDALLGDIIIVGENGLIDSSAGKVSGNPFYDTREIDGSTVFRVVAGIALLFLYGVWSKDNGDKGGKDKDTKDNDAPRIGSREDNNK